MKKKLYIIVAMLMAARVASAAAPCPDNTAVQVAPCKAGRAFTIRVPVRLPPGITGEYEWFRNGEAIGGTLGTIGSGVSTVAYTVPAYMAWGMGQSFYFMFRLSDYPCTTCWDPSPPYMISWADSTADVGCKVSGGAIGGNALSLCGVSAGGIVQGESVPLCNANAGGVVGGTPVQVCNANAGGVIGGTAVQVCNANAGGVIGGTAVQVCGAGAGGVIGN